MPFTGYRSSVWWLVLDVIILCVAAKEPNQFCGHRQNCMGTVYDPREFVCCGNEVHQGRGLSCCGQQAFNPDVATCCTEREGSTFKAAVTEGLSEGVSASCGLKAYNPLNEICCQSTVVAKPGPMAECCGKGAFDVENELCCGPHEDKKIVVMASKNHACCGQTQYDTMIQCCCWDTLQIQPINSSCCQNNAGSDAETPSDHLTMQPLDSSCCATVSGVGLQTPTREPNCSEPRTHLCGASCYNPNEFQCCEKKHTKHHLFRHSGDCVPSPTTFNPLTHICCDGCVSERKIWMDQCCGQTPYGLAQRNVLCCNGNLYKDRKDGEECSEISIPYNPAKGTMCGSQLHGTPGQHCCGTELYQPHIEICCNGHRHRRENHWHCCGIQVYNVSDPQMKCCGETLYNSSPDALCCGSIVQNELNQVCCSSDDTELLYFKKTGHQCCGHMYYNISLWSCCAGKLSPAQQPGKHQNEMAKECTFQSVNNLKKMHLCNKIRIGTIASVSLHSIVFHNVLEIQGERATVRALPWPYVLNTSNHCIFPKLTPGKTYFFNQTEVFTDFTRDTLQSIYFMMSFCLR